MTGQPYLKLSALLVRSNISISEHPLLCSVQPSSIENHLPSSVDVANG